MPLSPGLISLDTGFLIQLLNQADPLHLSARNYWEALLQQGFEFEVSTIAIAEYLVGGNILELPFDNFRVIPFNLEHAVLAASFARILYQSRARGKIQIAQRPVIINDAKLFAQAQASGARAFVTADAEQNAMYQRLRAEGLVRFELWNLEQPVSEYLGSLGL